MYNNKKISKWLGLIIKSIISHLNARVDPSQEMVETVDEAYCSYKKITERAWYHKLLVMTMHFHLWQFALKFNCSYNEVYHLKSKGEVTTDTGLLLCLYLIL